MGELIEGRNRLYPGDTEVVVIRIVTNSERQHGSGVAYDVSKAELLLAPGSWDHLLVGSQVSTVQNIDGSLRFIPIRQVSFEPGAVNTLKNG